MRARAALALAVWVAATLASDLWISRAESPVEPRAGETVVLVPDAPTGEARMLVRDTGAPASDPDAPAIVLIHGSPGTLQDFRGLADRLAPHARVIVPDLPGFGRSQRRVGDYSAARHGAQLIAMLDRLGIRGAHLVGFSMGGAVALEAADAAPDRVRSVVMVGGLGVEELELFGRHDLNRMVHAGQLAALQLARWCTPHFGLLDRQPFDVGYARNFFDTDQRRLRPALERFGAPMLILHGRQDPLVPFAAATEHARIVPQARTIAWDDGHFLLWTRPDEVAAAITSFAGDVEAGRAPTRASADADRVRAASASFDTKAAPAASGIAALVLALLLAFATFVSEDLACIGAGLLVASGRLDALPAVLGCLGGIFVGDLGLFLFGRALGVALLDLWPFSRMLGAGGLERARALLAKRGAAAVITSRFLPGLRVPTYLAAGVLGMGLVRFSAWFLLAAAVWTPLLVLGAAWAGEAAAARLGALLDRGPWIVVPAVIGLVVLWRIAFACLTWSGRRRLVGRFRRLTRFEFWPAWAFYPPVVLHLVRLAFRHGGFRVVTAVNPGIETGGFIGESKRAILERLAGAGERVARHAFVPVASPPDERVRIVDEFLREHALDLPVVLKPDVGQRGSGVRILRERAALERFLAIEMAVDHVVQEHVPGVELGIFWVRAPSEPRGRIFSITEKRMPAVTGDGRRTLEQLILADPRAVCVAPLYLARHAARADDIVPAGERVQLVELGTHCRGAEFLDGAHLKTAELEAVIEEVSRTFDGFFFGRYDARAPSLEHFRRGEGIKVIELNGVTSEATHVYDPKHRLTDAYRVLFEQWRLAFEIGAANAARGAATTTPLELVKRFVRYRRAQKSH